MPCLTFNTLLPCWLSTAGVMARTLPATGGRNPRFHPHPGADLPCNNNVQPYSRDLPSVWNHCSIRPLVAFPDVFCFVRYLYLDAFSCTEFKRTNPKKPNPPKASEDLLLFPFSNQNNLPVLMSSQLISSSSLAQQRNTLFLQPIRKHSC